ncbi:MAG: hypothetical protein JRG97_03410 [Deltaproteobacteria bacterium]|nr:hypothetical protein [Deltaproteobacteria bacterium]MBW2051541.1 hypothetical protein [Deltaproteobacteria bacterium]MBW2140106.1 hypothetical protein [Deltaproteobacteria bacterium]MBW2322031.1 hypothetical protein [Deltaproteobacteria bacterium]
MEFLAASGVCLAVLLGSVVYETRRMKKEERETRNLLKSLSRSVKNN